MCQVVENIYVGMISYGKCMKQYYIIGVFWLMTTQLVREFDINFIMNANP